MIRNKFQFFIFSFIAMFTASAQADTTYLGSDGVLENILQPYCLSCHSASGGYLPNLDSYSLASANRVLVRDNILSGYMPYLADDLSPALQSLITAWVSDGGLQRAAPDMDAQAASSVNKHGARLNGRVKENGINTSVRFRYSTISNVSGYTNSTSTNPSGSGGNDAWVSFNRTITGLDCGERYYFRSASLHNGVYSTRLSNIVEFDTDACPSITALSNTSATEDILFTYQLQVSNSSGDSISYSLLNAPSGMTVTTGGQIRWTPANGVSSSGTVTARATVTDSQGSHTAQRNFNVSVTAVNDPPSITTNAPTTAFEDVEYVYNAGFSDVDDSGSGVNWLLINPPSGMIVSSSGRVTWTPLNGVTTSGQVTLQLSDGGENGAQPDTEIFTISVTASNDRPIIQSNAPLSATEDIPYVYDLIANDVDNLATELTWSLENAPAGMAISNAGQITWLPLEGVLTSGETPVRVRVEDPDGGFDVQDFSVVVTPVNDSPVITSAAPVAALEHNQYLYQVEVSDPDDANNGQDLEFELDNAPNGMSISPTGVITWTPSEGTTTSGEFTIRVRDGGEDSSVAGTQQVTITVEIFNSPPLITSTAPTEAIEDIEYQYQVVPDDLDDQNNGADLFYELLNAPEGMAVSSTGLITWTPLEGILDSGQVTVILRDGGEDEADPDSEIFSINVTQINDAPQITSTAPSAVIELNPYSYQLNIEDPDDANNGTGELTFTLVSGPEGMTLSNTGLLEWLPPEGTRTSGPVSISVNDGGEDDALAAVQEFQIDVIEFNTPPTLVSTAPTQAVEDLEYSYQVEIDDIDDPNDGSGALTFELDGAPEGMSLSQTGLITWTPSEGVTSSGALSLTVSDGGEDDAAPIVENFTISVQRVNDAPVITSTAPSVVAEDELYQYQLEIEDPDDSNNGFDFLFALSNAPQGMAVSRTGLITWQASNNRPEQSTIIVNVSDGGEDGVQPATETFTVTVDFDVDADTILNVSDNCPEVPNFDQADNDLDGLGDLCDLDDDNDGMEDEYEERYQLDHFNPSDAALDSDGDGRTNLEESFVDGNPYSDDVPPSLIPPNNILVRSTGFETYVDLGQATGTDTLDGPLLVSAGQVSALFQTGRNIVQWTASDMNGNTTVVEQIVDVIPQLSVAAGQTIEEGQVARVTVNLNGQAVRYPVSVDYTFTGSASSEDHSGQSGTLVFSDNTLQASIQLMILADDITEGEENLVLNFSNPTNAVLSAQQNHVVRIIESNHPPLLSLSVGQNGVQSYVVSRAEGPVVISANILDPNVQESFSHNWSDSDVELNPTTGIFHDHFIFEPADVPAGQYRVSLTVADERGQAVTVDLILQVREDQEVDLNLNGIIDSEDESQVPYRLQTSAMGMFLETLAEHRLALGDAAIYDGALGSIVSLAGLNYLSGGANTSADAAVLAEIHNFKILDIKDYGGTALVVIPQFVELPQNGLIRQYVNSGWENFIEDDFNEISSAPLLGDANGAVCPGPGHESYQSGIRQGNLCIQLKIQDGGSNDRDEDINGEIHFAGGVGQNANPPPSESGNPNITTENSGGGSASSFLYFCFLILSLSKGLDFYFRNRRKLNNQWGQRSYE